MLTLIAVLGAPAHSAGVERSQADADTAAENGAAPAAMVLPFVSINASRGLSKSTLDELLRRFVPLGVGISLVHQGTLDMTSLTRDGIAIQQAPPGAGFPMSSLAVDATGCTASMGERVSATLVSGRVVMGATTARLRGAQVGDLVTLRGWNGTEAPFEIGLIGSDSEIGAIEIVLSYEAAGSVGFVRPFSLRLSGFVSPSDAHDAIVGSLTGWHGQTLRVRYSWEDPFLDDTVTQARIKELLGEFWVRRHKGGAITIDPAWKAKGIVSVELPVLGVLKCNPVVGAAASRALHELVDAGLAGLINVRDTRRSGGCYSARESIAPTGTSGRNLSRHSWGAAIDINPSSNRYGGISHMDPRVIEAFARQGFAWGGTFLVPDPMHFEYTAKVASAPATEPLATAAPPSTPGTVSATTTLPTTTLPTTTLPTTTLPTTILPTTILPTTILPTTILPTTILPTTTLPTSQSASGANLDPRSG